MLNIVMAAVGAIGAAGFDIEPERAWRSHGISNVTFKLTNKNSVNYARVHVHCVFFDKEGKSMDIGPAIVSNVAANSVQYGKASVVIPTSADSVSCSVTQVSQ